MLKLVQFAQRYRILEQTLALVGLVVAAKVGLHTLGWEFVAVSPLHASIVAGGIFILSVFLAGILPDYKEAERLPTEFAATVDSMFDDGVAISRTNPEFDSAGLRESLTSTLRALRSDILEGKRSAYAEIREITMALSDMERVNVPPNFITKLKQEQASLVKLLLRLYYIQRINFIPSAYYLVVSTAVTVIAILLVTNLEPFNASVASLALVAFVFLYLMRLIEIAETPFRANGTTRDDVSLFVVEEVLQRLEEREAEERKRESRDEQFYAALEHRRRESIQTRGET